LASKCKKISNGKGLIDSDFYQFGKNVGDKLVSVRIIPGEEKVEATTQDKSSSLVVAPSHDLALSKEKAPAQKKATTNDKATTHVPATPHDIAKVIEGVIKGAVDAEFSDLDKCVDDGVGIIEYVWDAVKKFKSENPDEVIKGIKDIGVILETAGAALTDCKDIKADLSKLTEMAAYFSNPETAVVHIGKDIMVHGVDIIKEITAAVKAMDQKDYYNFGLNIGKAASQILVGNEIKTVYSFEQETVKAEGNNIYEKIEKEENNNNFETPPESDPLLV